MFAVAAIVLFGWAAGRAVLLVAPAMIQLLEHRPLQRIAFNVAVLAIVATRRGRCLIAPIDGDSVGALVARVVVAARPRYAVNILLISAAIALSTGQPLSRLIADERARDDRAVRVHGVGRADAGRAVGALAGPLDRARRTAARDLALPALDDRALRAMRLALTDPLTGLGNHRHFHERCSGSC